MMAGSSPDDAIPARRKSRLRRRLSLMASIAIAVGLIAALLLASGASLHSALVRLTHMEWSALLATVLFTGIHTNLGAEKWRLANASDGVFPVSRRSAFALTAIGVGLGQILPVQIASALARGVGAKILGIASFSRGGATAIYEQLFDVLVIGGFACASLATYVLGGGALVWFSCVAAGAAFVLMIAEWSRVLASWLLETHVGRLPRRIGEFAAIALRSGCLEPRIVRTLVLLSIARFGALVLVGAAITRAIGLDIEIWKLGAALPFPVVAIAIAATPAGLGVNEVAMAFGLSLFGVPTEIAVEWTIAGRVVATIASLTIGACGLALAMPAWLRASSKQLA